MLRLFRKRAPKRVTVYGKPGCHLCDDAISLLDRLGSHYPMIIRKVDITSDPALYRAYDIRIPVINIDGQTEIEAPITEKALRRALR